MNPGTRYRLELVAIDSSNKWGERYTFFFSTIARRRSLQQDTSFDNSYHSRSLQQGPSLGQNALLHHSRSLQQGTTLGILQVRIVKTLHPETLKNPHP